MGIVYSKAKDGTYRMYDVETYWSGEEGVVKTYCFWLNGDIEAKT